MSKGFQYECGPLDANALPLDFTTTYKLGLYAAETNQRFVLGTRYTTWDNREFVYCKSTGACISGQGAEFTSAGYISYTTITTAASVGDTKIHVPAATHAALTEDYLAGGYIFIYTQPGTNNNGMFRGILGNDSAAENAGFYIYVDAPIDTAITTSMACEVYESPYGALQTGTMNYNPKAGVPAVAVSATGYYFWCQRRGPCWAAPQGGKLGTTEGGYCGGLWSDYGNVSDFATSLGVTVANGRGSQYAGYVMSGDADNIGPLLFLTG